MQNSRITTEWRSIQTYATPVIRLDWRVLSDATLARIVPDVPRIANKAERKSTRRISECLAALAIAISGADPIEQRPLFGSQAIKTYFV